MFNELLSKVEIWAGSVPLDLFVFLGSLIEEVIAQIPSPLVLITAGVFAEKQHFSLVHLLFLAVLASLGKTIGSWPFYFLADKMEHFITTRFGKFLGISHKGVEGIRKHFNGTYKDELVIVAARAIPFMPSVHVSIVAGFFKIKQWKYLRATFIGYFFRSLLFLYLGYQGLATYDQGIGVTETVAGLLFVILLVVFIIWRLHLRKRI